MGLIPREVKFFDLLEQQSETVVRGAKLLQLCLESKGSIDDMYLASKRIHDVEHEGDELVHRLMERLNKSFITPLDREDIHELTSRLDDVLDYVDAVAKRDIPVVQACGLIFAIVFIGLNLTADMLSILSNPRLRHPR